MSEELRERHAEITAKRPERVHRARTARDVNAQHHEGMSINERLAVAITARVGTMTCAWGFAGLALISAPAAFGSGDTLVIVSWCAQTFLQLVLLPLIMVGQNVQGRHAELRADADFAVNQKAEAEIEDVLNHLVHLGELAGHQGEIALRILDHIESRTE